MEINDLYPLKFKPILKEKIWGGNNLSYKLNFDNNKNNIGESWEISGVSESISVVADGKLKGVGLNHILHHYKDKLVGKTIFKKFGYEFPLLIKFIDAREHLSVQLHPNDTVAMSKHNCMGKTEMWYVLKSDNDSFIIADFNKNMTHKAFVESVETNSLNTHLKHHKVQSGDVFFISPGLIHAIGAGVMLAEIQQTSDITYRIYDWDRTNDKGEYRDLHQEDGLEAIDFTPKKPKIKYKKTKNILNPVVHNQHFKTDFLHVDTQYELNLGQWESFTILINVGNEAKIWHNHKSYNFKAQETYLIPACISQIKLETRASDFLVVHI